MIFNVTAEHIKNGEPLFVDRCPVALCMREALKKNVKVHRYSIRIDNNNFVSLPAIVQDFIDDFDRANKVGPFQFELDVE